MKNSKILWLSFISLAAICGFMWIVLASNKEGVHHAEPNANNANADAIFVLVESMRLAYRLNDKPFNYQLEDIYGNTKNIFDSSSSEKKIVLRYSELNCNICVDSAIAAFSKFAKTVGPGQAMILVESKNRDYISQFIRFNHINIPLYRITKKDEAEEFSDNPFLFVVDGTHQMKDVFYPHKELVSQSDMYYNTMFDKYFAVKAK